MERKLKLGLGYYSYFAQLGFWIVTAISSICASAFVLAFRMYLLLLLVQLPLMILGFIAMIKDCCGRRCTSPCCKRFYETASRWGTILVLKTSIPTYMISLTLFNLVYLIM